MFNASADQHTLGFLGRALSLELSAVQQYRTQARLVAVWGLNDVAEKLQHEAEEELGHVDRIIARMIALAVAPNASQLRPVGLGRNLTELLQQNQWLEQQLIQLYTVATEHCHLVGDYDNHLFFSKLLQEEQGHAQQLMLWMQQLGQTQTKTRTTTKVQRQSRATF